ncbi:unnamed protein product, partial [Rodentolepis nana]|uniref:DUF676 domain-containing protein n=1 Tax=Rodentolepis nana TaxID=102285 RepID=A0A158QJ39_RODNA
PEIRLRSHSTLSGGSVSSFDDPAIADLLSSNSPNSSVFSRVRRRRGQRLVLHSPETVTNSINADNGQLSRRGRLNRLYSNAVRCEVAEVSKDSISNNVNGAADVRLTGYRRIVDDVFESEEMEEMKTNLSSVERSMERNGGGEKPLNGRKQQEEEHEDESQSASFKNSTRKSASMTSLPNSDSSKLARRIRSYNQNFPRSSQNSTSSSHRIEHSISTPNLVLTALSSSLAAAASADNLTVEKCSRCGLPDLSTVTATTMLVGSRRVNGTTSSMVSSLSLPSLSSLDPNSIASAMATSSLSDSSGLQGGRPTMRRLKQQRRRKAIFAKKSSPSLVNFGSLSDLLTRSCQCDKSTESFPISRNRQTTPSASMDFSALYHSTPSTPVTDLGRTRRELSVALNPSILPSLSEDFRDPDLATSSKKRLHPRLKDSREHIHRSGGKISRETMGEFLVAMENEEEGDEVGAVLDTTDGQSRNMSNWVIRNPEKGVALVQNQITQQGIIDWILLHPEDGVELIRLSKEAHDYPETDHVHGIRLRNYDGRPRRLWSFSRSSNDQTGVSPTERRSLSQTFIASNAESENSLSKWSASSSERLSKVPSTNTMSTCNNNAGSDRLVNAFAPGTMTFVMLKEHLKQNVLQKPTFKGHIYSDFSQLPVPFPYFSNPKVKSSAVHLVICVHGLEGNCLDLRLLTMYLQLALPDHPLEFLMSDSNHEDTFNSLEQLRDNLVKEILQHIHSMEEKPTHIRSMLPMMNPSYNSYFSPAQWVVEHSIFIQDVYLHIPVVIKSEWIVLLPLATTVTYFLFFSFIGHSLGCVLIRAALSSPQLSHLYPLLHTFLSFCGPHLGTLYSTSGLVSAGMWALQKLKKSRSLLQLRLRDHPDLRETFMYTLSSAEGLEYFRHVLLVSSPQDHYVPHHSGRIELCKAAIQDPSELGTVYMEMVANLLQRLIKSPRIRSVVRYDVHYEPQASANHFIGRAAHIAVLDSDVFMEKFFCVSAAKFFRVDGDGNSNCNGYNGGRDQVSTDSSSVKVVNEERSTSTPSSIVSDLSLLANGSKWSCSNCFH